MAQIDSRLGDMIRSYREKLGLTQEEMAERLQVNLTHYGNIERAACNPSFSLFLRIAKELNLSVDAYLYSTRDDTAAEITRLLSKCSKRECQIILENILGIIVIQVPCKHNNIWILLIDIVYNLIQVLIIKIRFYMRV